MGAGEAEGFQVGGDVAFFMFRGGCGVGVGAEVETGPAVLADGAGGGLLGGDDGDGGDDGVGGEAGAVGGLDADAVLDEEDGGSAGGDERGDEGGVVGAVG